MALHAEPATEGGLDIGNGQFDFLALAFAGVFHLFGSQHVIDRVEEGRVVEVEEREHPLFDFAAFARERLHTFVDDLECAFHYSFWLLAAVVVPDVCGEVSGERVFAIRTERGRMSK